MKKFIWQKLYSFLLILSNRFPSNRINAWKIMAGTSLLLLSGGCTHSRQKNQPSDNPVQETPSSFSKESPDEDIFCYEGITLEEDTLQQEKEEVPPPPPEVLSIIEEIHLVTCYEPAIPDPASCYVPVMEIYPKQEANQDSVYLVVEEMPEFAEGKLFEYIQKQIVYPPELIEQGVEGRVVIQMVIERDGSVSNPRILRSIHPSLDRIALQITEQFPKWKPGIMYGDSVRVQYTFPITFRISQYLEQQENKTEE